MKRVITYGTFDLLHYGHINLLKRAKALGDYLIVALSTDEFNWNEKQKKCYFDYEKRKALLEAIRYVDLVIPEDKPLIEKMLRELDKGKTTYESIIRIRTDDGTLKYVEVNLYSNTFFIKTLISKGLTT